MDLVSIRMITDDLGRVVQFYEQVTGVEAVRYTVGDLVEEGSELIVMEEPR